MKRLLFLSFLLLFSIRVQAQQLDAAKRSEVVESAATRIEQSYVLAEHATAMAKAIREKLRRGAYDRITDAAALAETLANDLRAISKDKHLNVAFSPGGPPSVAQQENDARRGNFGFVTAQVLDGNIGYIDIRQFLPPELAARTADAAMAFVADTDALIFDLRHHKGGRPEMVAYLTSYLFASEPVLLNELYSREKNATVQFRTHVVPGRRYSGKVYLLTSSFTFSAAEEFAYNLKHLGRATLVGETTGGGAHPVGLYQLPHGFVGYFPNRRAVNPITKTNWEGIGVAPDVKAAADDALRVALARIAEDRKPANPAVRAALDAWLQSFNEDDRAGRERFLAERTTLPAAEFAQMDIDIRTQYGKYELVRVTGSAENSIEALLRHTNGSGAAKVAITLDKSGKIVDVQLQPASLN
jgi:retinol-binding protein 3